MATESTIGDIVRHSMPNDQLSAMVDVLVAMIQCRNDAAQILVHSKSGKKAVAIPPAAFDLILDALTLLAARDQAVIVALDDRQTASVSDLARIFGKGHERIKNDLEAMEVPDRSATSGRGSVYSLADVIARYRSLSERA